MKYLHLLAVSIFFLISQYSNAQGWQKSFDFGFVGKTKTSLNTLDGNMIVAGNFGDFPNGHFFLFKMDNEGDSLWLTQYTDGNLEQIIELVDGSLAILGKNGEQQFIAKLTAEGTLLWKQNYGGLGYSRWIQEGANGEILVAGRNNGFLFIRAFDQMGGALWKKDFLDLETPDPVQITSTTDGHLVFGWEHYINGIRYIHLMKINTAGEIIWKNDQFLDFGFGRLTDAKNGGVAILGSTYYYDDIGTGLARTNAQGDIIATTHFSGLGNLAPDFIVRHSDDLYFAGGQVGMAGGMASPLALFQKFDFEGAGYLEKIFFFDENTTSGLHHILPVDSNFILISTALYGEFIFIKAGFNGEINRFNTISGFAFTDENEDCVFQNDEKKLTGSTIQLLDNNGNLIATQELSPNDDFRFEVDTGTYQINVLPNLTGLTSCQSPATINITDFFEDIQLELGFRDTCPDFPISFNINTACGNGQAEAQVLLETNDSDLTIEWSNGDTGFFADNLITGIQTVTINKGFCSYQDSFLLTFDQTFLTNWHHFLGGSKTETLRDIEPLPNQEWLLLAETNSVDGDIGNPLGGSDFWLTKIAENGNLLWEKSYGTTANDQPFTVKSTDDGGIILMGASNTDVLIIQADDQGNELWQASFGGSGQDFLVDLEEIPTGGFIAVGYSNSADGDLTDNFGENDIWVVRIDHTGTLIWQKNIGTTGSDEAYSIATANDGNFLIAGKKNGENADFYLGKIDATGELLWENSFGAADVDIIHDLVVEDDGTIVAIGQTQHFNPGEVTIDGTEGIFMKMDAEGNLLTARGYGTTGTDTFRRIQTTSDGGFLVTIQGTQTYYQSPVFNAGKAAGFIKIDATGNKLYDWFFLGNQDDTLIEIFESQNGTLFAGGHTQSNALHFRRTDSSQNIWFTELNGPFAKAGLLPRDTIVCALGQIPLSLNSALTTVNNVQWDDGSTLSNRLVAIETDTSFWAIFETEDGCAAADEIFITASKLAVDVAKSDPHCGLTDGQINLQVSGNRGYRNISWLPVASNQPTLQNLPQGIYQAVVSDDLCTKNISISLEISENPALVDRLQYPAGSDRWGGVCRFFEIDPFGNYLIDVGLNMTKISENGEKIWTLTNNYGSPLSDVLFLSDSTYLFINSFLSDLQLLKVSQAGEVLNSHIFGGQAADGGTHLIDNPAGGFYVLGYTNSSDGDLSQNFGKEDLWVMKLTEDFTTVWSKNYGNEEANLPIDFGILPDGNLIILSAVNGDLLNNPATLGKADIWMLKLDSEGNLLAEAYFGGSEDEIPAKMQVAADGIIVVANTRSTDGNIGQIPVQGANQGWLFKTDFDFNWQWGRTFRSIGPTFNDNTSKLDILQTPDNITYLLSNTGWTSQFFAQINPDGTEAWSFLSPNHIQGKIRQSSNSEVLVASALNRRNQVSYYGDSFIFLEIDRLQNAAIPPLVQLPDDTLLCAGDTLEIVLPGLPDFQYSWSDGSVGDSIHITQPGVYEVVLSSIPSCTTTDEILIDFCDGYQLPAAEINCESATIDAGFSGATYLWSNGDTTPMTRVYESGWLSLILNLPNGNSYTDSLLIQLPTNEIVLELLAADSICKDTETGFIDLSATSPSPDLLNYQWNNGATTQDMENLSAGYYSVTVTDENSCQKDLEWLIQQYPLLELTTEVTDASCMNIENGSIQILPGNAVGPFQFNWSNGDTTSLISNLGEGSYQVTVFDNHGCSQTADFAINHIYAPNLSIATVVHPDAGQTNGSVSVTVSGAFPPLTISWSDGGMGFERDNLPPGTYTLTLTDGNGCTDEVTVVLEIVNSTTIADSSVISLFPNPVNDMLFIEFSKNNPPSNLEIYNILGQKMDIKLNANSKENTATIEMAEWSSGSYFIHYQIDKQIFVAKILKQ